MDTVTINVNGKSYAVPAKPDRPLLGILRDELDLTGTKYGCGEGQCGSCTVLVDGQPRKSCMLRLGSVQGQAITTIEGLSQDEALHPVQKAFLEADALQCGYCTPGMILTGVALLKENPNPTREEIIDAMQGNICRCGTYNRIVTAIQTAAGMEVK
ncbi:MAG: (2Fe-2S)-binding protein [bacterium]|jgi:aerobic-type carbon monoxide dehydrogenase small subunit (CoxS/CutS family)|nr:(2Fe-2S)-binding protein [bacterium]